MEFKKGDVVSRKSYHNDILFKVINIVDGNYILKGIEVRLYADAKESDLVKYEDKVRYEDGPLLNSDRKSDNFFYMPPKILQLDGDSIFLKRCLNYYEENNIIAIGKKIKEDNMSYHVVNLLKKYQPNVLVISGHDSYNKKSNDPKNIQNYKNSIYFMNTIKEARKYENDHTKLIIIAGACQSDYEELIKAGADFASSPKRINIHALDPAIIATSIALTKRSEVINLIEVLEKTKYGTDGMGGIECNGLMYVGYPR